jgi:predicted DsbA family dithiol-disulfide isomerase
MRAWVAFGVLVMIILAVNFAGAIFSGGCPKNTYGNGEKRIKYFSSPLCLACWFQKEEIKQLVAEKNDIAIEEYDVDFCREAAAPQYVRGVPAFLINDTIYYGLRTKEQLTEMIA